MSLNRSIRFLPHFDMSTYFLILFPVLAVCLGCVWRMRLWLTKHIATESMDPMPDTCWKWGSFYFNRTDPALVVPLRTGFGQSFNCARPAVCVSLSVVTITALVFGVLGSIGELR
jgi:uncharacterized membrane protein